MDSSGQELSRITRLSSTRFASVDWNNERKKSLYSLNRTGLVSSLENDASGFYFSDTSGVSIFGDTSLHRILASHAPAECVQEYLFRMNQHKQFQLSSSRNGTASTSSTIFDGLPNPPNIDQQNHMGVTSLHVATYRNSWQVDKIVQLLLCNNSKQLASIPMDGGTYPLHIVCGHNLTIKGEVLSQLLAADPSVTLMEDRNGDNPISLLWKNVLRFRWAVSLERGGVKNHHVDFVDGGGLSWMTIISPRQYLTYSLLMVNASNKNKKCDGNKYSTDETKNIANQPTSLHTICSTPRCPPLLLRLSLLDEYRSNFNIIDDVFTQDDDGMLPLHHAASSVAATEKFIPSVVFSTDFAKTDSLKSVIEILLLAHPDGAKTIDNKGRLPLHYALDTGSMSQRSLLALVKAHPEALRVQDPVSGLFPFMLAASSSSLSSSLPTSSLPTSSLPSPTTTGQSLHGSRQEEEEEEENDDGMEIDTQEQEQQQQQTLEDNHVAMSFLFLSLCPDAIQHVPVLTSMCV